MICRDGSGVRGGRAHPSDLRPYEGQCPMWGSSVKLDCSDLQGHGGYRPYDLKDLSKSMTHLTVSPTLMLVLIYPKLCATPSSTIPSLRLLAMTLHSTTITSSGYRYTCLSRLVSSFLFFR